MFREARLQDEKNRQNSIEVEDQKLQNEWRKQQEKVTIATREAYNWAINNNIAKEQARAVLPEGNTESTLYMAGSLRSWIHYCMLRMGNGTQKEHIEIAEMCWEILEVHFPNVIQAVESIEGWKELSE